MLLVFLYAIRFAYSIFYYSALARDLSALFLMISSDEVLICMSFVCHLYVLLFVSSFFRAFP